MKNHLADEYIESFHHNEESNTIEVVFRHPSNKIYPTHPPKRVPDKVCKVIYGVVDGKITRLEEKHGRVITERIEEKIIFE